MSERDRRWLLVLYAAAVGCSSTATSRVIERDAAATDAPNDMGEASAGTDGCVERLWYWDGDGDGHARTGDVGRASCNAPTSCLGDASTDCSLYWKDDLPADDCDDGNEQIYLGNTELCDRLDNDCDNVQDDGFFVGTRCDVDDKSVGACAQGGSRECSSATEAGCRADDPAIGTQGFHDRAAPNGSWDWNCDGQTELEFGICTLPAACITNCSGCFLGGCVGQYPKLSGGADPECGKPYPVVSLNAQGVAVCIDSTVTCH